MKYLLSIVIPTHNRFRYALKSIESILKLRDERLQIVVSDTSSNRDLAEYIAELKKDYCYPESIKYIIPDFPLDMTGNHNLAISNANGEYVCLIGDDDTVLPDCLNAAEWAFNNGFEIVSQNIVVNYVWPDFRHRFFGDSHSGRLYIDNIRDGYIVKNSINALLVSLENAAQGTNYMPKLYHGVVKKSLLDKIKVISGEYCHGSSPDVSLSIALSLMTDTFVEITYPITIPGASGGSNTGRSAMNKHKGTLSSELQTQAFKNTGWSEGVPRFFSVETVWAHAALKTLEMMGSTHIRYFNYAKLIALCKERHPEYLTEINSAINFLINSEYSDSIGFSKSIFYNQLLCKIEKIRYYLNRILIPTAAGGRFYISNISDVYEAQEAYVEFSKSKGIFFDSFVKKSVI